MLSDSSADDLSVFLGIKAAAPMSTVVRKFLFESVPNFSHSPVYQNVRQKGEQKKCPVQSSIANRFLQSSAASIAIVRANAKINASFSDILQARLKRVKTFSVRIVARDIAQTNAIETVKITKFWSQSCVHLALLCKIRIIGSKIDSQRLI